MNEIDIAINNSEVKMNKELLKIKEAICELYESIKANGITPALQEIAEKFRNEVETVYAVQNELREE